MKPVKSFALAATLASLATLALAGEYTTYDSALPGCPASHAVELTLTIGGQRLSCADPAL